MKRSRCPTSRLPSSARSLTIASTIRTAPPRRFRSLWRAPTWFLSRNRRERWRGRTYRSFAFCSWIIQYNNLIPPCLKFVLAKTSISFHFFFWVLSFEMQPHDLLYPFANLASYGGHLSHWLMGETKVECGVSEWDNEYVPSVCNDNHLKSASKPWTWSKRTKGNLHSILKRCRSWNFLSSIVHNSKMLIFWGEHWARGLICFVFFLHFLETCHGFHSWDSWGGLIRRSCPICALLGRFLCKDFVGGATSQTDNIKHCLRFWVLSRTKVFVLMKGT